jgi:hypothetical protein
MSTIGISVTLLAVVFAILLVSRMFRLKQGGGGIRVAENVSGVRVDHAAVQGSVRGVREVVCEPSSPEAGLRVSPLRARACGGDIPTSLAPKISAASM